MAGRAVDRFGPVTLSATDATAVAEAARAGLDLVVPRRLLATGATIRLSLNVGDRILVRVGDAVEAGTPLVERMRDVGLVEATPSGRRRGSNGTVDGATYGSRSGSWYAAAGGDAGELVARVAGTWRIASGTPSDVLEAPVDAVVTAIRPGVALELAAGGPMVPGSSSPVARPAAGSRSRAVRRANSAPQRSMSGAPGRSW